MRDSVILQSASEIGQRAYDGAFAETPQIPGLIIEGEAFDRQFLFELQKLADNDAALDAVQNFLIAAFELSENRADSFFYDVIQPSLVAARVAFEDGKELQSINEAERLRKMAPWLIVACLAINIQYKDDSIHVQIPNNTLIINLVDKIMSRITIQKEK